MNVRPAPENGHEYIGPSLDVSLAVVSLTTDADVLLCGSAVEQLDEVNEYSVLKPLFPHASGDLPSEIGLGHRKW